MQLPGLQFPSQRCKVLAPWKVSEHQFNLDNPPSLWLQVFWELLTL